LQIKILSPTIDLMNERVKMPEESWDKKKIAVALVVLLILIAGAVYFFGAYKIKKNIVSNSTLQIKKSVEGAQTSLGVEGIREAVQQKINAIKTEASNVNLTEVASSSPQIQKVINDLKSLENYPSNQAKSMCEKICNQL
jgi:hypothetical protein